MPITDELIKIKWKRLNSPFLGTLGAAPVVSDEEEQLLRGLSGFTLPCPSVRHGSVQMRALQSQEEHCSKRPL